MPLVRMSSAMSAPSSGVYTATLALTALFP
jgi:hypothetical protein